MASETESPSWKALDADVKRPWFFRRWAFGWNNRNVSLKGREILVGSFVKAGTGERFVSVKLGRSGAYVTAMGARVLAASLIRFAELAEQHPVLKPGIHEGFFQQDKKVFRYEIDWKVVDAPEGAKPHKTKKTKKRGKTKRVAKAD